MTVNCLCDSEKLFKSSLRCIRWSFAVSALRPKICFPPVTKGEPPGQRQREGPFLFVWGSRSTVVSSTLVMIGLVGCFSPSQTKG